MTPLVFIKMPEKSSDAPDIVGCTLMFENSINQDQDKVLILRGIDPQDRLLAKASADSYCESVIAYAKEVAKKKGCKYIAANTHQNIISNRPGVVSFFSKFYPKNEAVGREPRIGNVIKLNNAMNFNGYEITNSCQIISIIE
jgi:hypothetical protein